MTIPFLDLRAPHEELRGPLEASILRVVSSGWYILGPEVEAFERSYAEYVGAAHCIGVANGLDALTLMLSAAGIGPGDEVIVPSNTYIATWLAVTHVGATIVPVEPDPTTYNLDPSRVRAALTSRTKAILAVHLYGQPADCDALAKIAADAGVLFFDDAAQSQGARWHGRRVGGLAHATAWSFYPGKNLGALGDAGAVTTNDDAVARRVRQLRNYGSERKYHNEIIGWNSRLDPIQAAVLGVKLPVLDAWNARRVRIARLYTEGLSGLSWLTLPSVPALADPVWHLYVVRTTARDALQQHLERQGVQTLIHYPIPPHLQPAYAHLGLAQGTFPLSEAIHREVLSLPMGPHLAEDDARRVVDAIRAFPAPSAA